MLSYLKNKRRLLLILIDMGILLGVFGLVLLLAFALRGSIDPMHYLISYAVFATVVISVRILARVYSNVWRYANSRAYLDMVLSDLLGGILALVISYLAKVFFIGGWECVSVVAMFSSASLASRFVYQQRYKHISMSKADSADNKISVAIVGAGQVGSLLAEELLSYKGSHYRPVCFVDDSLEKVGSRICGLPVLPEADDTLVKLIDFPVQEIFIAMPSLSGEEAQKLLDYYGRTGCKVKLYDFPCQIESSASEGEGRVIREFKIEDLLFRKSISVTDGATTDHYRGKTVLVTGGGGSIGSELCRQIAKCSPRRLVIFDIYENNAYDIQQELIRCYGDSLDLVVEIGSVRDRARLDAVFACYRPDVVFHAAAHKHVPLMEHSNCEAIKNNCLGTYNTADMAEKYGVAKFILISTDKAVNPTNVMGASKRMCEMIIQCRRDSRTVFSAVRFGNVLGSNGSVIPLFKRQIAGGGPVTLTDRRIIRYFMTIPEAAGLVMQAGAMARCGELFVLDMGKPVRIVDLAENMIKLSGLRPYVDIPIVETGLRPGEKLYEELLIRTEELEKTENNLIFIERDTPHTREEVEAKLDVLRAAVAEAENTVAASSITEAMRSVIPTFHSPEEVNKNATRADEMRAVASSTEGGTEE